MHVVFVLFCWLCFDMLWAGVFIKWRMGPSIHHFINTTSTDRRSSFSTKQNFNQLTGNLWESNSRFPFSWPVPWLQPQFHDYGKHGTLLSTIRPEHKPTPAVCINNPGTDTGSQILDLTDTHVIKRDFSGKTDMTTSVTVKVYSIRFLFSCSCSIFMIPDPGGSD